MIFALAFAAGLAVLEYFLYFHSNSHFFQGDSIYHFFLRDQTLGSFLLGFFKLDQGGWYRPLTARTVQSLLYPWFGLSPPAYRVVHYLLFMATIFATYKLASVITRRRLAACIATIFFSVHTVNAWTTYDVLFTPELVFTFFYVSAAVAYMRYRQSGERRLFLVSLGLFAAGLCSKETALTLPLTLVALDVLVNRAALTGAFAAARLHFAILALYLVMVVGYLGVQRPAFQSILKRPGPEVSYQFALGRNITNNADVALTWAFNIPRGWPTESRGISGRSIRFLKLFRLAIAVLALWMLFRPERRLVAAGVLWFFIAIGPALPLFGHFLPYYLFMPLVGFSIAIGVIGDALYRKIAAANPRVAASAVALPLLMVAGICAVSARRDARDNRVLGVSSRLAENSMNDLRQAHPTLPPNTTIYLSDAEETELAWDTAQGAIFKMAYNDNTLHALYWGWGEVITKGVLERGPVVVMKYSQFHLTDVTEEFLAASDPVAYRAPEGRRLEVSPATATAGERYWLSISPLENVDVTLHYSLNGGPVRALTTRLDDKGRAAIDVAATTEKGVYKFVGFKASDTDAWFQAASQIRIQ